MHQPEFLKNWKFQPPDRLVKNKNHRYAHRW